MSSYPPLLIRRLFQAMIYYVHLSGPLIALIAPKSLPVASGHAGPTFHWFRYLRLMMREYRLVAASSRASWATWARHGHWAQQHQQPTILPLGIQVLRVLSLAPVPTHPLPQRENRAR